MWGFFLLCSWRQTCMTHPMRRPIKFKQNGERGKWHACLTQSPPPVPSPPLFLIFESSFLLHVHTSFSISQLLNVPFKTSDSLISVAFNLVSLSTESMSPIGKPNLGSSSKQTQLWKEASSRGSSAPGSRKRPPFLSCCFFLFYICIVLLFLSKYLFSPPSRDANITPQSHPLPPRPLALINSAVN